MDGLEQTVHFAFVQACCIHQQNHVGRRGRTFGFQAGENARIICIYPVDLDARGFGKAAVERFIRGVVAC